MMIYAFVAFHDYPDVKEVVGHLYQPYMEEPVGVKVYDRNEVYTFIEKLDKAIRNKRMATGPHCQYCPHAMRCGAYLTKFDVISKHSVEINVGNLTNEKLVELQRNASSVGTFLKEVRKEVELRVTSGEIAEFKVTDCKRKGGWIEPDLARKQLTAKYGDAVIEPSSLRLPSEVARIVEDKKEIEGLYEITHYTRLDEVNRKKKASLGSLQKKDGFIDEFMDDLNKNESKKLKQNGGKNEYRNTRKNKNKVRFQRR